MLRLLLAAVLCLAARSAAAAPAYDLVIRNGRIVDGSGNPWFRGDVAIRAGKIAAVGKVEGATARTIDAKGMIVAPGFIDVHTHVEDSPGLATRPTADNFVADGVTTVVTGNCGLSAADVEPVLASWDKGTSINVATLIGHNGVRGEIMGRADREPTPEELAKMEALVERAMSAGAVGLSTGLIYVPGIYAKTPEIVALARVAARHGGLYVTHMRDEGIDVVAAVDEAIAIGQQAGLPVQISHHKVASKRLWGHSTDTLARIEAARGAGVDVTLDQYPYTASSTRLSVMLPGWALAGDFAAIQQRLADPATRKKMAAEMRDNVIRRNGRKRLDHAVIASYPAEPALAGKNISEITRLRKRPNTLDGDIATVFELMERGGASTVLHTMDDRDVERILRFPHTMIASDGGVQEPGEARPHPRSYGTNARVLARYVRDRHVLALEDAIRRMTSLPAQRFRFSDRGLVRPGGWADLVIFDDKTVVDRATFEAPHAYAEGFRYVLVNGEVVWQDGKHTGARPGKVLRGR